MGYRKEAVNGVKWNTVAKIVTEAVAVAQLAIVARFIDKADFGSMSIVHVVLGMVGMFTDLGMYAAMIHKQDTTQDQYNSLYWMNWALSVACFLIVCVAAWPVAKFYGEARLTGLIILTGTQILLLAFGKVFYTIKQKNLEFAFISQVRILLCLVGFALTVLFAVLGFGVYALILPGIVTGVINALVFSLAGRKQFRIRWHFNFAEIKDYFKIGLYDTGAQLLDYVSYKIDVLLVGRFFGMETLGLYNMGKELALKTMKIISPIINSVATPILAKLQDSAEAVKENYLRILRIVALVNFPVLAAFFVFADPVVVLFLSEKYQGAAPFLRILCFWGMFASVGNPAGNLVIAKGRTDLSFKWTIIRVCCAPLAVFIAAKCFGTPNSVAYSQVVLQLVFFFIYWRILIYPLSGITAGEYCGALSRGFSCAVLSALTALVWHLFFAVTPVFGFASPLPGNHWADLIGGCVVFSGAYFAYSWLLNREMYRFLGHVLKKG